MAAHTWQLLMAGQLPVILWFTVRWLPRGGWRVTIAQFLAGVAAVAPVFLLGW